MSVLIIEIDKLSILYLHLWNDEKSLVLLYIGILFLPYRNKIKNQYSGKIQERICVNFKRLKVHEKERTMMVLYDTIILSNLFKKR